LNTNIEWSAKALSLQECSLKVSKFRCFGTEPQGFDCIKPINIIIGRNNSGKSTLLEACRIAFSSDAHPTDGSEFFVGKRVSAADLEWVPDEWSKFSYFNESANRKPRTFCSNKLLQSLVTVQQVGIHDYKFLGFDVSLGEYDQISRKVFDFAGSQLARVIKPIFEGWSWLPISSERSILPEASEGNWVPGPNGNGVTKCIEFLSHRTEDNRIDLIENQLVPSLNQILGPDNVYKRILLRNDGSEWEIYLEEKNKGIVPISATGSGVKTVLQVLVSLVMLPSAFNKLPGDYIFAFEELENNLHPATVRRLFEFIRGYCHENKCHFFITTHSHVVIDMFCNDELAQVLHVTHDGSFATVKTLQCHSDAMKILCDLDVRASDLFQTNVVVWVEGPTDAIFFERWVSLHSNGELQRGIDYQCVTYGGSNVNHLTFDPNSAEHLLEATRVCRHSIFIVDSNREESKTAISKHVVRIAQEVTKAGGLSWITEGREIENYLPLKLVASESSADLKDTDMYTDLYKAIRDARGNKSEMSKMKLANRIAPKLSLDSIYRDDLSAKLTEVCDMIRKWNRKDSSA
jgi:putative ATP-dependent endonuclease of OLD family